MDKRSGTSEPGVGARDHRGRRRRLYLLVVFLAVAVALVVVRVCFDLTPRSVSTEGEPARLEGILRPGEPEFDEYRGRVEVAQPKAAAPRRAHGDSLLEVLTGVTNRTGRTVTGLELRGVVSDERGSPVAERGVAVIPAQQTALRPEESVSVAFLVEGVEQEPARVGVRVEVTGLRFERAERDRRDE